MCFLVWVIWLYYWEGCEVGEGDLGYFWRLDELCDEVDVDEWGEIFFNGE